MTLAVYGATGATGRRIVQLATAAGVPVVALGRNRDALARLGVEYRVATLAPAELDMALTDATVVVSCAGPYTHFGPPVLDAALRAGAGYVDCTGEPRWVQRIIDEFESRAVRAGVAVVPGLGLGVATDIAAAAAAELLGGPQHVRRLHCAVKIVGMRPSTATLRSTVELVAGGAPIVENGCTHWELTGRRVHPFATGRGALFSTPDALVLARAYPQAHIECHVQPVAIGPALAVGGLLWRVPGALPATRRILSRRGHPATDAGGGHSLVTAEAEGPAGRYTVTGAVDDLYDITGRGAFAVARALLGGAAQRTGLRNAGQFLAPPQQAAADLGVRLTVC